MGCPASMATPSMLWSTYLSGERQRRPPWILMMRCPRPVTLRRWYTRWLRAVSVHCTLPRSPWRHLWEVRVCTLRCTRRCTRGGQPTISEPIDCFLVDSRYPAAASSASYMSVLPCQSLVPCVQRCTLQRDFGRAKDHRAWPVPVLLKQGVYKLCGGVRGGGALSAPRLEALKRCRNQVTAVRDVVACSFPTCHVGWSKFAPWRGEASPTATNSWCHGTGFGDCSPSAFCWCWCTRE